ncbi:MAG: nitrile hydratase accessory protein [Mycobacteriales bacterium]
MTGAASEPPALTDEVTLMAGETALPRNNGELVFDEPWQARSLAMALGVVQRSNLPWDAFRSRLVDAVSASPQRPYYESWTAALETLVVDLGLASPAGLDAATPVERPPL